jgi:hypothetical protein
MLHPDRRKAEREAQRDEFKIIACLSIALVLAVVLFRRWSHGIAALAGAGTPPAMVATRT